MDNTSITENNKVDLDSDIKIQLPQVLSHAIGRAMADIVPALESVIQLHNIPMPVREIVTHAQLVARELASKTSALTEMFGESDFASLPKIASYNLKQFLDVFTEHLNNSLKGKTGGKVIYAIDDESDLDVIFDSKRVATILYHLISNSLQHGKTENKNVKILCKSSGNLFEMIVRDYGGGIPKEIQPTLFSHFQKKYSLEQDGLGMLPPRIQGLGLPLCLKLTRDLDGEITFKNYRGGAQFTIVLPQKAQGVHELEDYTPDDALLQRCFASFWLYLDEKKDKMVL